MVNLIKFHIFQALIWIDQGINVLLGGYADETLSQRAYRAYRKKTIFGLIFMPLIDCLFFWQKNHCENAYLSEIDRRQLPEQFLKWKDN